MHRASVPRKAGPRITVNSSSVLIGTTVTYMYMYCRSYCASGVYKPIVYVYAMYLQATWYMKTGSVEELTSRL